MSQRDKVRRIHERGKERTLGSRRSLSFKFQANLVGFGFRKRAEHTSCWAKGRKGDNSPVAGNPFGMINAREDSEFRGGQTHPPVRAY